MIVFESTNLRVVLDPNCGGKIRSIVSKRTGTEFLFQDPRAVFDQAKGFSYHDISGIDECFPTVGQCNCSRGKFSGMSLGDHGLLWQQQWNTKIENDAVVQWVNNTQFQFRFTRVCSFYDPCTLRLDYTIHNYGVEEIDYIYSAHPLFLANEHTRLELPQSVKQLYITAAWGDLGLKENRWANIPFPLPDDLHGPYNHLRQTLMKAFTKAEQAAWIKLHRLDCGESLEIKADTLQLPHMGILISQGFDTLGDGDFKGRFLLGIEPTSGIGDDLEVCGRTGTVRQLMPGQIMNFWITIGVQQLQ